MDLSALKCVKVVKRDGVSWVYLNRPEKKNAMNPQLHEEMDNTLAALETDPDTKSIYATLIRIIDPEPILLLSERAVNRACRIARSLLARAKACCGGCDCR